MEAKDRIIVALDVKTITEANALVGLLAPYVGYFKIGLELIIGALAQLVTGVDDKDLGELQRLFDRLRNRLFWDGKWNDIPNTMKGATLAIQPLNPAFINVHASAGLQSIKEAVVNKGQSRVLGVTVLTSLTPDECQSIFGADPKSKVLSFANMLLEAGADGIICSPQELELLRKQEELGILLMITPGVRPEWADVGDQKRVMTPAEAIKAGATALVIGRPITKPPSTIGSPVDAAKKIAEEITAVL
jgi:orotidine-5'-phosphate decarboxylase